MISTLIKKVIGSKNERVLRGFQPLVQQINILEAEIKSLSDYDLQAKTAAFKERWGRGEVLDELLPEAVAVVREVAHRTLQMRHFDCQL